MANGQVPQDLFEGMNLLQRFGSALQGAAAGAEGRPNPVIEQLLAQRRLGQQESQFTRGLEHERGLQTERLGAEMSQLQQRQEFDKQQAALARRFDFSKGLIMSDDPEKQLIGITHFQNDPELKEAVGDFGIDPSQTDRLKEFARLQIDSARMLKEQRTAEAALAKAKAKIAEDPAKADILFGVKLPDQPMSARDRYILNNINEIKKTNPKLAQGMTLALFGDLKPDEIVFAAAWAQTGDPLEAAKLVSRLPQTIVQAITAAGRLLSELPPGDPQREEIAEQAMSLLEQLMTQLQGAAEQKPKKITKTNLGREAKRSAEEFLDERFGVGP